MKGLCATKYPQYPTLRRVAQDWKVSCSNSTECLAGIREPTSIRGSWWFLGKKRAMEWLIPGDSGPKLVLAQPSCCERKKLGQKSQEKRGNILFVYIYELYVCMMYVYICIYMYI